MDSKIGLAFLTAIAVVCVGEIILHHIFGVVIPITLSKIILLVIILFCLCAGVVMYLEAAKIEDENQETPE